MTLSMDMVECFIAVAEEGNVGRAARRLSMTQPPLSRKIQRLEKELGVSLFHRDATGMVLTPSGTQFLDDAYRISSLIAASYGRVRMEGRDVYGTVGVGFTAISTYNILPKLLKLTSAYLPKVSVKITERLSPVQVEMVSRGRLDVGFIRPQELPANVSYRVVDSTPLIALVPERSSLAKQSDPLTPSDLAALPLIRYEHHGSPYLAKMHDAIFATHEDSDSIEVSQVLSGAAIVAEGIGAMIAPAAVAKLPLPGLAVRRVDLPTDDLEVPTWAVFSGDSRSPLAERLLEYFDELTSHLTRENNRLIRSLT